MKKVTAKLRQPLEQRESFFVRYMDRRRRSESPYAESVEVDFESHGTRSVPGLGPVQLDKVVQIFRREKQYGERSASVLYN